MLERCKSGILVCGRGVEYSVGAWKMEMEDSLMQL